MAYKKGEPLKKVQLLAHSYYSRKEIQKAIFEFSKHRETIPRYLEGFGKRPDCLDYSSDVLNSVKKGATSFHCSEELWQDPMKINTNMTKQQYNEIKIGWDFLIDIDSKYLDYSKIAAQLLIKALEHHGVKNIGIKFSGSKGFHIIIPFKSFPKQVSGIQTKDMFPEWPRLIAEYINDMIHDKLIQEILLLTTKEEIKKKGKEFEEITCLTCNNKAQTKTIGKYVCPNFKCRATVDSMKSNRKEMICPSCNDKMQRTQKQQIYYCENCKLNSKTNPENFQRKATAKQLIDSVDIVLVASRHLFRTPYSLHEKTALASIVIDKESIENFKPLDADPLKIKEIKSFMPESTPEEAKELLFQALDWAKKEEKIQKKYDGSPIDLKGLKITEQMFPPIITKILKGIKSDGRKRALYILLSFFNSLEFPQDYIIEKINDWNEKNQNQLKQGYINSQIDWFSKRKILPPNYDKPIYSEFGLDTSIESKIKNPINYTIKRALKEKSKQQYK